MRYNVRTSNTLGLIQDHKLGISDDFDVDLCISYPHMLSTDMIYFVLIPGRAEGLTRTDHKARLICIFFPLREIPCLSEDEE